MHNLPARTNFGYITRLGKQQIFGSTCQLKQKKCTAEKTEKRYFLIHEELRSNTRQYKPPQQKNSKLLCELPIEEKLCIPEVLTYNTINNYIINTQGPDIKHKKLQKWSRNLSDKNHHNQSFK